MLIEQLKRIASAWGQDARKGVTLPYLGTSTTDEVAAVALEAVAELKRVKGERDAKDALWRETADARTLLAELETFHANNAGDRAIKILRRLVETASPITSAELVERTGDNPGPVDTQGFPPELREPSPLVATIRQLGRDDG